MSWIDRKGNPVPGDNGQDRMLEWMYGTRLGRVLVLSLIHI